MNNNFINNPENSDGQLVDFIDFGTKICIVNIGHNFDVVYCGKFAIL